MDNRQSTAANRIRTPLCRSYLLTLHTATIYYFSKKVSDEPSLNTSNAFILTEHLENNIIPCVENSSIYYTYLLWMISSCWEIEPHLIMSVLLVLLTERDCLNKELIARNIANRSFTPIVWVGWYMNESCRGDVLWSRLSDIIIHQLQAHLHLNHAMKHYQALFIWQSDQRIGGAQVLYNLNVS